MHAHSVVHCSRLDAACRHFSQSSMRKRKWVPPDLHLCDVEDSEKKVSPSFILNDHFIAYTDTKTKQTVNNRCEPNLYRPLSLLDVQC